MWRLAVGLKKLVWLLTTLFILKNNNYAAEINISFGVIVARLHIVYNRLWRN